MRTLRTLALIPALAIAAAACGGASACACTETTPAPNSTAAAQSTNPSTSPAPQGSEFTVPATAAEGPVQIDVVVGEDSGPNRIEKVVAGADITLNITNPNAADEYHVHGVDLEQKADRNVMATMNFTMDTPGTYQVESHVTKDVLLVIEVD
jgi:ABC-type glycerol-3-phosphate transport system substrate-binding protein